jgi:hypothetical protein
MAKKNTPASGSVAILMFKDSETKRTVVYKQPDNAVPDDQNPHRFYLNKALIPDGNYPPNIKLEVTW